MKRTVLLPTLVFFWFATTIAHAAMNDYCVIPTPSATITKPNILILMDYSGSMQFPTYVSCNVNNGYISGGKVWDCQSYTDTSNYDSNKTYYGLFDSTKYYRYSSSKFQVNSSCTNTDKIGNSNTCISGNLLNWVTATRIDVARKALTGGRTTTGSTDTYQSEGAKVTYTDSNLYCKFTMTVSDINDASSRTIKIDHQTGHTCVLGTLTASNIDIAPVDPTLDTGIVQDFYDRATFEFMIFNSSDNEGKLLSSKDADGTHMSNILSAMSSARPYWGTPTGEAMLEAKDFFKQSNDNSYQTNSSGITIGDGTKDPWYDVSGGTSKPIRCRKSFILLISDGQWNGSVDPVGPARTMRTSDLRNTISEMQRVTTYAIYAWGDGVAGKKAMITTAIFGGFDDNDSNGYPYPFTSLPPDSRTVAYDTSTSTYKLSGCDPAGTWDERCREWDKDRSGKPYNYFEANDGDGLKTSLSDALNDMLRRASSGTAASVLASSEGTGANILQSVFYPQRQFGSTEISWTGEVQNLWYYIDPYLQNTSIREDTNIGGSGGSRILNLTDDYAIEFFFDTDENQTKVRRYSTNADGSGKTLHDTVALEDIKNLWEAGSLLFQRNLGTSPRTIYTTIDGTTFLSNGFSTSNSTTLAPYLNASSTDADKIINYVHGVDQTGYRNRTVTISGTTGVWKLGDIVSSTPRVQSATPTNSYHLNPPDGYADLTYREYIRQSSYLTRGMAYVGGNDGMIHAFKFGNLQQAWSGQGTNEKAQLANLVSTSTPLGSEMWAFVPKNALPYLKYLMEKNYGHLNLVDLPPVLVDASVSGSPTATKTGSSWKTILIGGMGLGGASRITTDSCTAGASGTCVKTPINDPSNSANGLGYSSYFAIDVTDPTNPQLLWEFSDPTLGFSTSGPAIVRIGDADKNGKWFAVFASGPTGPIDTTNHQFLGVSDQNLKLFVVNLYSGSVTTIDTGISNAFGGSLYNAAVDLDRGGSVSGSRYSDDVIYLGYTTKDTSTSTWTKGGVLRIVTKEDQNPSNWSVSSVINTDAPVTSSITKLQDRTITKSLWLYFGSGRFFYRYENTMDDASGQRALYGIMEPCYNNNVFTTSCTSSVSSSALDNQSGTSPNSALTSTARGWYINLDGASGDTGAERVITDPLAVFSGVVFFTTYAPSSDVCSLGGNTYVWAVKYNVGNGAGGLIGKAITQVSTGAIQELNLSSVFTQAGGRKTAAIIGMPPKGQGLSVLIPPRPLKRFLHIRQK